MISKEAELELLLKFFNNKILFYNNIYRKTPTDFLKNKLWLKKILSLREKRDTCFKKLRILIRKKHPELFIRG